MSALFAGGSELVEEQRRQDEQSDPTLEFLATAVLLLLMVLVSVLLFVARPDAPSYGAGLASAFQAGLVAWAWWNRRFGFDQLWVKVAVAVGSIACFLIAVASILALISAFLLELR